MSYSKCTFGSTHISYCKNMAKNVVRNRVFFDTLFNQHIINKYHAVFDNFELKITD